MTDPNTGPHPQAETPAQDDFLEEQIRKYRLAQGIGPVLQDNPLNSELADHFPPKNKLLAGVLSFLLPGTGHFYLGLMQKGLFLMLLFILNVAAIPYSVLQTPGKLNIPLVVLLGCLVPVIYFYNLFDALQSTDQINAYRRAVWAGQLPPPPLGSDPLGRVRQNHYFGVLLIGMGALLFAFSVKPNWLEELTSLMGSYVGAVMLIGAGLIMFIHEARKR